jgi:hypothetical protein
MFKSKATKEAETIVALKYKMPEQNDDSTWESVKTMPSGIFGEWCWYCVHELKWITPSFKRDRKILNYLDKFYHGKKVKPPKEPYQVWGPTAMLAEIGSLLQDGRQEEAFARIVKVNNMRMKGEIIFFDRYYKWMNVIFLALQLFNLSILPTPLINSITMLFNAIFVLTFLFIFLKDKWRERKWTEEMVRSYYYKRYIDKLHRMLVKYEATKGN